MRDALAEFIQDSFTHFPELAKWAHVFQKERVTGYSLFYLEAQYLESLGMVKRSEQNAFLMLSKNVQQKEVKKGNN
jgi:hypothetical protein